MRKVIFLMMQSLDGFMADPKGELGWVTIDEELHTYINDMERTSVDTHLYGRRMYELMREFWPTADLDPSQPEFIADYARIWKGMDKVVFSRSAEPVEGNARVVTNSIADEVNRLKAQPGKNMTVGGSELASAFIQQGLIDEYHIYMNPIILGSGIPLFRPLPQSVSLRLAETHPFRSGVVLLRYEKAE